MNVFPSIFSCPVLVTEGQAERLLKAWLLSNDLHLIHKHSVNTLLSVVLIMCLKKLYVVNNIF